jgi:hypothetical protein
MLTETEFKNPGKWFRGIPFWSINDKLEASSELDITRYVKPGTNEVKVTLVGTLGNVLGPLHRRGDLNCVGPETFYVVDGNWTDEYVVRPFGLEETRVVMFRREATTGQS